jgi:D-aminoacyl-tRNA deacylase
VIGIVVSRADPASERIGEALLELGDWSERADPDRPDADGGGTHHRTGGLRLRTFDDLHIRMDDPAPAFGPAGTTPAALVFASKHSGDTGPLLSAHHTGNFGPAELGGRDRTLAPAAPGLQKRLVAGFAEHAPPGYDVGIECTHHGPTAVSVPSVFAELGSSEAEWGDPEGARAVARSILSLRHGGPASGSGAGPGSESESESGSDDEKSFRERVEEIRQNRA